MHKQFEACNNLASCGKDLHHSIECTSVGHQTWLLHHLKELKGILDLTTPFAGTDQSIVGDFVGHHTLPRHCLKELLRLLKLAILFTSTECCLSLNANMRSCQQL